MRHKFSVIIPTYNAAEHIGKCLRSLRHSSNAVEIVVCDGGSTDTTVQIARELGAAVVQGPKGRGVQLNQGLKHATGDVLVFLHADSLVTGDFFAVLEDHFRNERLRIAKCRLAFDRAGWLLSLYARVARVDSLWTSFGDQGIVIRKDFFDELGRFPDWPLLEDVALFRKARNRTRILTLPVKVTTSAERFVRNGLIRQQLFNAGIILKYLRGVPPRDLAVEYEHFRRNK